MPGALASGPSRLCAGVPLAVSASLPKNVHSAQIIRIVCSLCRRPAEVFRRESDSTLLIGKRWFDEIPKKRLSSRYQSEFIAHISGVLLPTAEYILGDI